ncbi:hypothetical protein HPB50_003290 [Hyalomma asiaticum]|uniref:Uncharacterized protein n=1 Tax=Hyalomma asiaticum TaxID=266040 RepID=A0ACB7TEB6_HYAAI|nr:hypothetical protein HPB50_003290 [Hyalomma asiaticum]
MAQSSRKDQQPNSTSNYSAVCSLRFLNADFPGDTKRRMLKPGTVPSVFPSYLRPALSKPRSVRSRAKRKCEGSPTKSTSNGVSGNITRVCSTQKIVSDTTSSVDCMDVPVSDNSSVAFQDYMQQCCASRASENSKERTESNSAEKLLHPDQTAYAMRSFGTQTNEISSSAAFLQSKKWRAKEKALKAQNERLRSTVDAYKKELERLKEQCHISKFLHVVRDSELAYTKAKIILDQKYSEKIPQTFIRRDWIQ